MARVKKIQFWLDNAAGTLTEYSADTNQASLRRMAEIIDETPLNVDDRSVLTGTRSFSAPVNGWYNDTTVSNIGQVLHAAIGTSVTKTFQLRFGSDYYYGECFPNDVEFSGGAGRTLVTWSCSLEGDGAVTRSSVAAS